MFDPSADTQQLISERVRQIRARIAQAEQQAGRAPGSVRLMAVTKTVSPDRVNQALSEGVDLLGENRVQEFLGKNLSYHCEKSQIHFIGHLQTNKIRDIINRVSCIQSIDSLHLAKAVSSAAEKAGIVMPCLLEVNVGREESKSGFEPEGVLDAAREIAALPGISLHGLMTVAPAMAGKTGDDSCFRDMQQLFLRLQELSLPNARIDTLSMGMTGDFELAIRCGSTLVRVGQGIFGARDVQTGLPQH